MRKELFRLESVSKRHNEDQALRNVSLSIYEGEIVKVLTDDALSQNMLARILGGQTAPDRGKLYLDGREITITSPFQGRRLGIHVIYKKNELIPNLSVQDNLYLDRYEPGSVLQQRGQQARQTRALLDQMELPLSPDTLVSELTTEQLHLLQMCKVLLDRPRLVVIDYAFLLTPRRQMARMANVFRIIAAQNAAVLVLSQNPKGLVSEADRTYVVQNGMVTASLSKQEMNGECVQNLVDTFFSAGVRPAQRPVGEEALRVQELSTERGGIRNLSFTLRRGEVLGMVSDSRCDLRQLAYALYGMEPIQTGQILLRGKAVAIRSSADAIRNKIALLSCEERENGLFLNLNARENVTISRLRDVSRGMIPNLTLENCLFDEMSQRVRLDVEQPEWMADRLSIAEQRKLNLARALSTSPSVLILIEPTVYLDNSARREILCELKRYAEGGGAVLLFATGYQELLELSSRILVFRDPTAPETQREHEQEIAEQLYMFQSLM